MGCRGTGNAGGLARSVAGLGRARADVQRVNAATEQRFERLVYQAMPLERGSARERRCDQRHAKVAARTRPGMPGMPRAVIDDLERDWSEGALELRSDLMDSGRDTLVHRQGPSPVQLRNAYHSRRSVRTQARRSREQGIEYLELHPVTPQARLIHRAVHIVRAGGVIAYPTDSCYALGWHIGDARALERVRRIRRADRHHHFTLVCADLAQVGRFARLETWQFRLLRSCLPGPFTFLLKATRETPRRLLHPRRRTIGVRVPDHPVPLMLMKELGEPLMSSTLWLPDDPAPLTAGRQIEERLEHLIEAVLDGGDCGVVPTTVVDLSVHPAVIVRAGKGAVSAIDSSRPTLP